MSRTRKGRFDTWEVVCIAAFMTVLGLLAGRLETPEETYWARAGRPELEPYGREYGPQRFSTGFEEWLVRDYFHDRRGGFFVDVGAGHYQHSSNTYYLEKHLGWSGIAMDALPEFEAGYRLNRPRTKFFAYFVSDKTDSVATLWVSPKNTQMSSLQRDIPEQYAGPASPVSVRTTTLNALLAREHVETIDFLSVDVELAEQAVLTGFDLGRYRPALVCIEAHPQVRQTILEYFARRQYIVVGRFLRVDVNNLYFAPLGGQ